MRDVDETIISQYANSPRLLQIIRDMDEAIDPRTDLDDFYNNVWNLATAQTWGLDVWGRIVGVSRVLRLPGALTSVFGFSEATGCQPFGQAPFYSPQTNFTPYILPDEAFRAMIYVKALANISGCSFDTLNRAMQQIFLDYGRCYVHSNGLMKMRYVFEFVVPPTQLAILLNSNVLPRPTGVKLFVLECIPSSTFGFNGSGMQPFGQGTFSTGETNVSA
jgi:hypothetical protein